MIACSFQTCILKAQYDCLAVHFGCCLSFRVTFANGFSTDVWTGYKYDGVDENDFVNETGSFPVGARYPSTLTGTGGECLKYNRADSNNYAVDSCTSFNAAVCLKCELDN